MRHYSMAVLTLSALLALRHAPLQAQNNLTGTPTTTHSNSSTDVYFINRAKNLARQAAIKANGGLERYRPNAVMYGPAVQTSYVNNSNGSITFTFTGGTPGTSIPSIETVATVMPDGSVNLDYNGIVRGNSTEGFVPPVNTGSAPAATTLNKPVPPAPLTAPVTIPVPSQKGLPTLNPSTPTASMPQSTLTPPASASTSNSATVASSAADQDAFLSKARNLARQTAIKENGGLDRYRPEASMFGPSAKSPFVKNTDGSVTFTFKGGSPGATVMTIESVVTVSSTGSASIQYNGPVR